MFAGLYRGGEMHGPEGGRRRHQHVFAVACNHFLIAVIAAEATVFREAVRLAERERRFREGVGHGHEFRLMTEDLTGCAEVRERAGAPAAAADHADFDFAGFVALGDGEGGTGGEAGADECGVGKEGTSFHDVGVVGLLD